VSNYFDRKRTFLFELQICEIVKKAFYISGGLFLVAQNLNNIWQKKTSTKENRNASKLF